jgi:alpha-beta hydrolase superfamily lysophospholipase
MTKAFRFGVLIVLACCSLGVGGPGQTRETLLIREREQSLYIYGTRQGDPVVVSSGDGGWMHLGPHVAEVLSSHGYFVIGFDVRAYLSSFTSRRTTLDPAAEPGDYRVLARRAREMTGRKPVLVGVSEGAGLSLLAATDPDTKDEITGVVALGLPDMNELGWRWRDMVIYVTHRPPDEPAFSAAAVADRVAPLPLAAIHSTHDEFVPVAQIERLLERAKDPKRLWIVDATDHAFDGGREEFDRRLLEAMAWVQARTPR